MGAISIVSSDSQAMGTVHMYTHINLSIFWYMNISMYVDTFLGTYILISHMGAISVVSSDSQAMGIYVYEYLNVFLCLYKVVYLYPHI
jgi:urease alpha subunit